jgi:hypothetical protein
MFISNRRSGRERGMRLLGKDPDSAQGSSPTIWDDGDTYVIQGWHLDAAALTEVGPVPAGEGVVRIPKRMMMLFPEVAGGGSGA